MLGCFENLLVNDTSLDARPLPSLQMRRRSSALSAYPLLIDYPLIIGNN